MYEHFIAHKEKVTNKMVGSPKKIRIEIRAGLLYHNQFHYSIFSDFQYADYYYSNNATSDLFYTLL